MRYLPYWIKRIKVRTGPGLLNSLDRGFDLDSVALLLLATLIGTTTGLAAILFVWLLRQMASLVSAVQQVAGAIPGLFIVMGAAGLLVGYLIARWAREAKGHGVPEVMEAIATRGGRIRAQVAGVKVLASSLTIGAGGSAGREGPIVQVGAALGSSLGQVLKVRPDDLPILVACGAAAGIAATFNAPIAGSIFALEVILRRLDIRNFGAVVISSVAAAIVGRIFLGANPAFDVPAYALNHLGELPIYLVLAVLAALVALLFIHSLYFFEGLFEAWHIPLPIKTTIGMLLTASIGLFAFQQRVLGPGLDFIGEAIADDFQLPLGIMLSLLAFKLLATTFTLGSGNSGGVFAPALFMGAVLGGIVGQVGQAFFPEIVAHSGAYAIVGMSALFAAAARAPVTAILIVFEMSNDYRLILPLMLATVIATLLAETLFRDSIYTLKLRRRGILLSPTQDIDLMQGIAVSDVMSNEFETVPLAMSLADLVAAFESTHHHGLPVVDQAGRLAGVISIRDLEAGIKREGWEKYTVADLATTQGVQVAFPDESMWRALRRLGISEISVLPVVERTDPVQLVGVIRRRNVIQAYNQAIAQHADRQHRSEVLRLGNLNGAGFIHVEISRDSRAAGQMVSDVALPDECLIVSVRRERSLRAVHGDTVLQPGDRLTVFASQECIPQVLRNLAGRDQLDGFESGLEEAIRLKKSIPEGAVVVGSPLKTLQLPATCILVGIERGGQPLSLDPDLIFEAGDVLEISGLETDLAAFQAGMT